MDATEKIVCDRIVRRLISSALIFWSQWGPTRGIIIKKLGGAIIINWFSKFKMATTADQQIRVDNKRVRRSPLLITIVSHPSQRATRETAKLGGCFACHYYCIMSVVRYNNIFIIRDVIVYYAKFIITSLIKCLEMWQDLFDLFDISHVIYVII